MHFTDIFIRRPVLASVISLLITIIGVMAFRSLPLRQFPEVNLSNITISSNFPGATAQAMQSMVTQYIQDSVASIDGIDYIESSSSDGNSTITIHLLPGTDVNAAITEITTKVQQTKPNLPTDPSFDYINRVISTKLQAIEGVAGAGSIGSRTYAMRIWLDPALMASKNVTMTQVQSALTNNNTVGGAGYIEGKDDWINIDAQTGLNSVQAFNDVVVRKGTNDNTLIRIKDIGYAQLGATSYNTTVMADGKPAVVVKITTKAGANPLTVANNIKKILPNIIADLPGSMHAEIVYDQSRFIQDSVNTVIETIIEASIIVVIIIFLCLGSLRAVFIPLVTIPLSLIGVCGIMMMLGFSLNVLTLLAFVLAIGLVVDDAIVVSENITRHLENGLPPIQAALLGAREIASPVITMSLTLAAVFLPVGLAGGLTGVLFSEFSYTLAGTVLLSCVISLTLSPMMCSKVLSLQQLQTPFVGKVDRFFEALKIRYQQLLTEILSGRKIMLVVMLFVLASCVWLYLSSPTELAPTEDQGVIFGQANSPTDANIKFTTPYMQQIAAIVAKIPDTESTTVITNRNDGQFILLLKPRDERHDSAEKISDQLSRNLGQISGLKSYIQSLPTLPGGNFGDPLQFALLTPNANPELLFQVSDTLMKRAQESHIFKHVDIQMKLDTPLWEVTIDRSKAAQMGITSKQIIDALNGFLGGGRLNYFRMEGMNYQVIPQAMSQYRETPEILKTINIVTDTGKMVPLANFISFERVVKATTLRQFNRLNSTYITATMAEGYSLSQGLDFMIKASKQVMPAGMSYDIGGQARQMVQEGNRMVMMFIFAVIIIFLVLAAQFESFRDPFVIMLSVPMSLFGALLPLYMGFGTINLFTQIGFLALVGLISKHGILIVQFANRLQETEGYPVQDAVIHANVKDGHALLWARHE